MKKNRPGVMVSVLCDETKIPASKPFCFVKPLPWEFAVMPSAGINSSVRLTCRPLLVRCGENSAGSITGCRHSARNLTTAHESRRALCAPSRSVRSRAACVFFSIARPAGIQGGMKPMSIESWFVLTVAAAFLLIGIAGSPLAWVALHHRKSQLEKRMEERWDELTAEIRRLEGRLALAEGGGQFASGKRERAASENGANGRGLPNRPFLSGWRKMLSPMTICQTAIRRRILGPGSGGASRRPRAWVEPAKQSLCCDMGACRSGSISRSDRQGHRPTHRPDRADSEPETAH